MTGFTGTLFNIIWFLAIFVFILFMAYFVTKILNQKTLSYTKSNNMQVIEHIFLGHDKNLYIVKVGSEYILIGVTSSNINYIKKIKKEDIAVMENKKNDFKCNLDISLKKLKTLSNKYLGGNKNDIDEKN
ncbi:flagellar biosynthetic protein FliO [Aceticella autotrophica]|uniref:Flagellar protein n=1 Tax=Aceticella autotrophica TaxID=2755338 RepID=A0A974Y2Y3_9THEO|nr:flagellar biosynthetic protein FliO [Aceticella autotrophica]QSZ26598.1 flagellar biosynthetic protein FliO [Aceticella autotrophica]